MSRMSADYLGVALPGEKDGPGGRDSALLSKAESRKSRPSIDMLHNPFGANDEDIDEEEELEVNLDSWGVDNLLAKDKGKEPQKKANFPNPHPLLSVQEPRRPTAGARAASLGSFDKFGAGGAFLDARSSMTLPLPDRHDGHFRHRSMSSPLELARVEQPENAVLWERRNSAHALMESLPVTPPLHSVPFPTSPRSQVALDEPSDNISSYHVPQSHQRTYSTTSLGSRVYLNDETGRRPRFDSMGNRILTTVAPSAVSQLVDESNPFTIRPPSPSRSSRFDPKSVAHARTISNASMGSRLILDDAATGMTGSYPRERLQSRFDLLRPKVLIMPSPLQGSNKPPPEPKIRDGFHITKDGPPLPPGAKSASRSTVLMSVQPEGLVASNSFTPNPRASLSLAQLTFRSTLHSGSNEAGYSESVYGLPRATEEGEQVQEVGLLAEEEAPVVVQTQLENESRPGRVPGKLFGRSLIDDLESRKAVIRGKRRCVLSYTVEKKLTSSNRVFQGDERPSMMARSTTFIDPSSLQTVQGQNVDPKTSLVRRRTLLNLDETDKIGASANARKSQPVLGPRASNVKTVFGVDTLWEREMAKLREMEALERRQAGLPDLEIEVPNGEEGQDLTPSPARVTSRMQLPPTKKGPPPLVTDEDEDEGSDTSEVHKAPERQQQQSDGEWFSDEDKAEPVRTVGSGPRYPKRKDRSASQSALQLGDDDDSEEDVPLAATVDRAIQRATRLGTMNDEDSDEDKPLNALLDKTKLKLPSVSSEHLSNPRPKSVEDNADEEDEDDDKPLGLKAGKSRIADDDDDRPLAFHPEQQRRTQYQMMAQQQVMMQAQFQNSMMFAAPSFMGTGLYGSPIPSHMLAAPIPTMIAPPQLHDTNKFGRVDRWRRDVAVEGETTT
jgi:hypothetical protein